MSWLNINESLNNLKGQLSNFAHNVLTEEDQQEGGTSSTLELKSLQDLCQEQQAEIKRLRRITEEFQRKCDTTQGPKDERESLWSWDSACPPKNENEDSTAHLKETILKLKSENEDLNSNIVLLDSEHQANMEKIVKMKNKLQSDYNELEDKYEEGKGKIETLLKSEKKLKHQLENLQKENLSSIEGKPPDLNAGIDKLKVETERASFKKSLEDCQSENRILLEELQKANESIVEFEKKREIDEGNCKKLASILEGYEQQVSGLKEELKLVQANPLKSEIEGLQGKLQQTLDDKNEMHRKYIQILTTNMKKYVDYDKSPSTECLEQEIDPELQEFNHHVESILNILVDLKIKCENLEDKLLKITQEKTEMLSQKNHEIEKLIQNSEILSQEVISKSQTLKDYESECNELMKNNDLLINELNMLKNNTVLQTISESNEDNLLLLEGQLETANKKIEELENILSEKDSISLADISLSSTSSLKKLQEDFHQLEEENLVQKQEIDEMHELKMVLLEEKESLTHQIEKIRSDLENTEYQYTEININVETLKEDLENQKRIINDLTEEKLHVEKQNAKLETNHENIRTELSTIKEKLFIETEAREQCDSQIRNLTEKLQNAKMAETSLKLQHDTVNKELISTLEAKYALEINLNEISAKLKECQVQLSELRQENEQLKSRIMDETNLSDQMEQINLNEEEGLNLQTVINERNELQTEIEKLKLISEEYSMSRQKITELEKKLEELEVAKSELTNVIITKHHESITYHNEIQRLSQILNRELEKSRTLETELASIKSLSINPEELHKKNEEIERLLDQNNFLSEKCGILTDNLLEEQSKVLSERNETSEKEQILNKKLDRLQGHLIEVEEHYTHELLRAEEKNKELQIKLNEIEAKEKNSTTMYTSVSIRANQQVETLQHQLQLITNQRDELRKKISDAEDRASKQEASLTNLQFVLEQFQKDKERDIQVETERLRRQITEEKKLQEELSRDISSLQCQLQESKQALLAATRLSDQLEQSKILVTSLKVEVSELKEKLSKNEEELRNASSLSDGKVDKSLIKNLLIGFVTTNNNLNKDQKQILKIMATVLDFNQQDHEKVQLNKPQQGWLGSLLSPQTQQGMSQESLSQAFVKFLENESTPRLVPSLLNNNAVTPQRKDSTGSSGKRESPSVLSEMVLPTFADFAQNRSSSSILKDVLKDNS